MFRKVDLSKLKTQYFIGLFINLLFLVLLYSFDTSYKNVQIPKGIYQNNIWQCSDVLSYVDPAINYTDYGVFGKGSTPDHFRTIGYPAMISFFYNLFGRNWLIVMQIFQAIIFALIYPIITATIKILLPDSNRKLIKIVFIFLCISGAYFAKIAAVLTDSLFILLFTGGFYYGLKTYITNKKNYLLLFFILITLAGLVRPTLTLFPLLNLAMGYWIVKKYNLTFKSTMLKSLYLSIIFLFLLNISTFRNYVNYSFPSPSSVVGNDAFNCLSRNILIIENKDGEFNTLKQNIDTIQNINIKVALQKKIMFDCIKKYPISTIKALAVNSINVFFANNLIPDLSQYFGYNWKVYKDSCYSFKISKSIFYTSYFLMLIYAILWFLLLLKLFNLYKAKDYETLILVGVLFIMFIIPAMLAGGGGARIRLPFEHFLFIYGFSMFFKRDKEQLAQV